MKGYLIKAISLVLLAVLVATMIGGALAYDKSIDNLILDGTQSSWAEEELIEAYNYGLTYLDIMGRFKQQITREEFCTIVVKLYEKISGKKAVIGIDPFTDTDNPEILKAYKLKIVNGTAADKFSPSNKITRQEICVMIFRTLNVSVSSLDLSFDGEFPFDDANEIASWAIDAVKFSYKNGIMKGTGNNKISPLSNTTREEAIVLLKRTFEGFTRVGEIGEADIGIPVYSGFSPTTSMHEKFKNIEPGKNLAFLDYDERIELFVSTKEAKPSSLPLTSQNNSIQNKSNISDIQSSLDLTPTNNFDGFIQLPNLQLIDKESVYTSNSYSAFIDANGNKKRWFAYKLSNASNAIKVIWQVSKSPFNGFTDNWKNPVGIVGSGEVTASTGEFQIDFENLKISTYNRFSLESSYALNLTSSNKPIPQKQFVYYVRAVPVDFAGNAIGEPGQGMAVIYGERIPEGDPKTVIEPSFELWSGTDYGYNLGEFLPNAPMHYPVTSVDSRYDTIKLFHFHDIDDSYRQVVIQVAANPFPFAGDGWPETQGLVYEETYDLPSTTFADAGPTDCFGDDDYPATVPVKFSEFSKSPSEMEEGEYTKYYVRGVAIKQSLEPGKYDVIYSDTLTVEYGYSTVKWYSDSPYKRTEKLDLTTPGLGIKNYTPVQWQESDFMHHYYVFREPSADEIKCKWKNADTGEILYPYIYPYIETYYEPKGINSKAEYEAEMIPRVLPKHAKVYFPPPKEEDKAWYEQLFDGIVDFFNDLGDAIKTVVNQVSKSYENLKSGLIEAVVNLCPYPSLKDEFRDALEVMVDSGLASMGIPPTLPNFDQLTEMSMDYLAEVALTEAGIPANDITDQILDEVSEEIKSEIKEAANHADHNPIDAPFLKLDPDYLYRPAYVDVEIYNNREVPSVAGSFNLYVTFEFNGSNRFGSSYDHEGIFLQVESNYVPGSAPFITDSNKYYEHFYHGLNGNTVDYQSTDKAVYDVFYPRIGVKVPALGEGESRNVRVYLDPFPTFPHHLSFTRYPEGDYVRKIDFENMYFNNGSGYKFTHFTIRGQFPTPEEYLLDNGYIYLDPETDYCYAVSPVYHCDYEKFQRPVNSSWSK